MIAPVEIVHDVQRLLAGADGEEAKRALQRLADRVAPGWPIEQHDALLRGVDVAVVNAGRLQLVPSAFSPVDARLAAKLEGLFGDSGIAEFWREAAAAMVPLNPPLRLPHGTRFTRWALPLCPVEDLAPPVFAEWLRLTAKRCAEGELLNDAPEADTYQDEMTRDDAPDALDLLATEDERAWRGARFLAQLARRRGCTGPLAYAQLLLAGHLVGLSTEAIASRVSVTSGQRVSAEAIRQYRVRLTDLALVLDP